MRAEDAAPSSSSSGAPEPGGWVPTFEQCAIIGRVAQIILDGEDGTRIPWNDLIRGALQLKKDAGRATRLDLACPGAPAQDAGTTCDWLTPEWCMETFYRVNPGAAMPPTFYVPSLYLLDFAREVLQHKELGGSLAERQGAEPAKTREIL